MRNRLVVAAVMAAAVVIVALAVFSRLPIAADPAKDFEVVSIGKVKGDPDKVRRDAEHGKFVYPIPDP